MISFFLRLSRHHHSNSGHSQKKLFKFVFEKNLFLPAGPDTLGGGGGGGGGFCF